MNGNAWFFVFKNIFTHVWASSIFYRQHIKKHVKCTNLQVIYHSQISIFLMWHTHVPGNKFCMHILVSKPVPKIVVVQMRYKNRDNIVKQEINKHIECLLIFILTEWGSKFIVLWSVFVQQLTKFSCARAVIKVFSLIVCSR